MNKRQYRSRLTCRSDLAVTAFVVLLLVCGGVQAEAKQLGDFRWSSVDRVVAVGDLHGDYDQYMKVLRSAELVDKRGRWSGGTTHLVQTGDIPDRGPDTQKIIKHIQTLKKQAKRKGGMVHTLIGNHEAMNVYGDLRYVHPGEFEFFVDRNSKRLRERQWDYYVDFLRQKYTAEEWALVDLPAVQTEWESVRPLGWVEHRSHWIAQGDIGAWVIQNPAIVMVNDALFMHGGLSAKYCRQEIGDINTLVTNALVNFDPAVPSILDDADGPLWYRGLAQDDEEELEFTLEQILERYGAKRIVVGHTTNPGVVWPRFEGRVIVNDAGIGTHYGAHEAFLELSDGRATAGYGQRRLQIPTSAEDRIAYLETVIEGTENNAYLKRMLRDLLAPPEPEQLPADETGEIEPGDLKPGGIENATPLAADADVVSAGICQ